MRFFSLASLSFFGLLVSAQTSNTSDAATADLIQGLTELPACVLTCIQEAIPKTTCELTDLACLCTDQAYAASTQQCLLASCSVRDSLRAERWQYKACPVKEHHAGQLTVRFAIALLVVTALIVGGRLFARWHIQTSSIGIDDWTILAAYIIYIPATILDIIMAEHAMGQDIWTVPFSQITEMLRIFYMEQYFYQVVVALNKISIVLLFMRIFPKEVSVRFHYICWATIGGLLAYMLAFIIVFAAECQPISFFWTQWDFAHEGHCIDIQLSSYINGGINIFFDLVVFILPIPKLVKLQVSDKKKKIGVILTFSVGLFVTACSIVRLQYLAAVGQYTNVTYHYNDVSFWTGLEAYLGIICACMPSILGPLTHFFKHTLGSKISSYAKSSGSRSKSSANRSRTGHDKSATRLPSDAADRIDELELAKNAQKRGETEKTSVKSLYTLPGEQTSREDIEMVYHSPSREGKGHYGV